MSKGRQSQGCLPFFTFYIPISNEKVLFIVKLKASSKTDTLNKELIGGYFASDLILLRAIFPTLDRVLKLYT